MQHENDTAIHDDIAFLYGRERAPAITRSVMQLVESFRAARPASAAGDEALTERDCMLITYADMVSEKGAAPLAVLHDFLVAHLEGVISSVHVLPFFPSSSDDGFSVIDYRQVDPQLGTWEDIRRLRTHFKLMFDGVINHTSARNEWFQSFLRGDPAYQDWFIAVAGHPDLSQVVRPRALPLLTPFSTPTGEKAVWTTFSADQIDLNYHHPAVLLEIIDTLLLYVSQGADFIRLDAIAYLWKEVGTSCIHLSHTHAIIRLLRAILNEAAPSVRLCTETNVPHPDNVSYWGDGRNEAQLVYNFALPPLTLHTLSKGDARVLSDWAASLSFPSDRVTFFNFLASHDGIGLNPARGLLTDAEIEALVEQTLAHGGCVSDKHNADGTHSPYELNINYFDALSDPAGREPLELQVDRFMAAQSIMLALAGIPGIYFHSLFGSRGWPEGVTLTGQKRAINRRKLERAALEREMSDPGSLRRRVFERTTHLLRTRAASPAFHPHGAQQALDCGKTIFAVERVSPDGGERVVCAQNVSDQPQTARLPERYTAMIDLLSGQTWQGAQSVEMAPYQARWLRLEEEKHATRN